MSWQWPAGACGFLIALVTTPAGVSGAVLLLPVQVSVLGVVGSATTPTNLLFNMVSVPGGLLRFWRERRLWGLAERVARLQSPLPEASLRRLLGLIACLIAARYTQTVVEGASARTAAHASSQ